MVQTVVFSTNAIGVNLNTDINKGVFDRFRSLPDRPGRSRSSVPCSGTSSAT